ncbi:hypothetical protein EMIHUDRAFT_199182 [Emiliania huxleyi CCMP1516]|uniref:Amine oxidase domain-containing protein n=2 Tax=Emiliania huxleyi TaxID=2903 RepID=A0A0D3I2F6_EMIH1|nr:hypothetical protein EMIHUDRAFT_199182 [Emiliania huxleyi CCMP1516]EOD05441.1 hypothetical protein EMIHUDRAFT_199182 [Emiliania huxleyi CCMP1516]|eukprot:XP_005757870.1 hypothetical protein EMIHUDRAFT_199182 [Emiliania huxleyi CCMP1516]
MGCTPSKVVAAEPPPRDGLPGPTGAPRNTSFAAHGRWPDRFAHERAKICIVGAGACGLLMARKLQKMGYQHVHVYEQAGRVGGYATTIEVDGRYFDVATKYIPTATAHGKGAIPPFQEIMDEYQAKHGFTYEKTPGIGFYSSEEKAPLTLPPQLEKFSPLQIVQELIAGFDMVFKLYHSVGVGSVIEDGIALPGETCEEWAKRNNLEAFGIVCALIQDAFGAGPTLDGSAAWHMSYREHYIVAGIYKVLHGALNAGGLKGLGVQLITMVKAHPVLKELLDEQLDDYVVFTKGFENFWKLMHQVEQINVSLNTAVTSIAPAVDGRVQVASDRDGTEAASELYDTVIVTTPPKVYDRFLPTGHPMLQLARECANDQGIEVWLVRVGKSWDAARFGTDAAAFILTGQGKHLATHDMPRNGKVYALSKAYADSDVVCALAYKDPALPALPDAREAKENVLIESMRTDADLEVTTVIGVWDFAVWPTQVPAAAEKAGWYTKVKELQGKDGIFFLGEHLFSAGVQSPADCVPEFCEAHF